ncbi:MAG: T9SS type A sorting domain-containing protein [Chitinophagales bacterium]
MKHKLLLTAFVFITTIVSATHLRGGFITAKYLGGNTFQVSVTTFSRNSYPSNLADRKFVTIDYGDGNTDSIFRINGPDLDADGIPDGEDCANDLKKSIYQGIHTYAGMPPPPNNCFVLSYLEMNRIDGINNIANGGSVNVPFFLSDTLFNADFATSSNSSPNLFACLAQYGNVSDSLSFNPAFYDEDGDSMSFTTTVPLQDANLPAPLYKFPNDYCAAHGFGSSDYHVDSLTAQIVWHTPCAVGIFDAALQVREFRCGVLLSSSIFDFQIIALSEPNSYPVLMADTTDIFLAPGDTLSLTVTATDDSIQQLSLYAWGEPFTFAQNPATLTVTGSNPANGNIYWAPDASQAQKNAYIFSIEARDNYAIPGPNGSIPAPFSSFKTFRAWVTDTSVCNFTSVNELTRPSISVSLWPNPSANFVTVQADEPLTELCVFDAKGQRLLQKSKPGNSTTLTLSQLPAGLYFMRANINGQYQTLRFIKE